MTATSTDPQPTRIVFVRQAIAKKIERVEDIQVDDQTDETVHDIKGGLEHQRQRQRRCRRGHR